MDELESWGAEVARDMSRVIPSPAGLRARVARRQRIRRGVITGAAAVLVLAVGASLVVVDPSADESREVSTVRFSLGSVDFPSGPVPSDPQAIVDEIAAALLSVDLDLPVEYVDSVVRVDLVAGRDGIGDSIVARYGPRVAVTVGGYVWPLSGASDRCPASTPPGPPPDVSVVLDLDARSVPFGRSVSGTARVSNNSRDEIRISWGGAAANGLVTDELSSEPVGGGALAEQLVDNGALLPPGGVTDAIPVIVTTLSCAPTTGTALRPGEYVVLAIVGIGGELVASNGVPIQVVADAAAS